MHILVTGAAGFIGRALCASLLAQGHSVRAVVRTQPVRPLLQRSASGEGEGHGEGHGPGAAHAERDHDRLEIIIHPDLALAPLPAAALRGIDAVVHLAGIARVDRRGAGARTGSATYAQANVQATRVLAEASAAAGVPRLVFLSSTRVYGATPPAWLDGATPAAADEAYGASKLEAEEALARCATATGLQAIALRIPAVYGPGGKGGLAVLIGWLARRRPLPLGALHAPRSLLYVGNLVAAITRCITLQPRHPGEPGFAQYLLADAESLSLADLIATVSAALDQPPRNWAWPAALLHAGFKALGQRGAWQRLSGAAQIDSNRFCQAFHFEYPSSAREGLAATARAWRARP